MVVGLSSAYFHATLSLVGELYILMLFFDNLQIGNSIIINQYDSYWNMLVEYFFLHLV